MRLRDLIVERIRARGPLTFAEFMELALYHPQLGYYTRAARRSGRAGDFFTSPDVGPVFGALLAVQVVDCWRALGGPTDGFDLVDAGASDGQLARDVLDALAAHEPTLYRALRLYLVERSAAARHRQPAVLGAHTSRLAASGPDLPPRMSGVLIANELLDALPVHVVRQTRAGLEEIYVDAENGDLVERAGPPSTPALASYFDRLDLRLEPGWRAEVNLAALDWVRAAARVLHRGFLILIDYGHEARELYSAAHPTGTLAAYRRHVQEDAPPHPGVGPPDATAPWLDQPGSYDLTADVDFTSIARAAHEEGLSTLGLVDQTYFLLNLVRVGVGEPAALADPEPTAAFKRRSALKTLLLPGGMGSTHKVLILAKGVGTPALCGLAWLQRMTP